jgi:parvulin-like peptidyl-prolyl isomerase
MPKKNKLVRKSQPIIDDLPETADAKRRRRKNNTIIIASAILAVIIGVSVFGWYLAYKRPLLINVLTVNGKNISVDYILRRCLMSIYDASTNTTTGTANPMGIINTIMEEQTIEQTVAKPPYNIIVTEADIDQALRNEADLSTSGSSTTTTMTDAEFNEWYRQLLNNTQLSDEELRELIKVGIMEQRLNTYLADSMPTTADQVHLWDIVVADQTTAADIEMRINHGGEDFATIAKELSIDSNTSAQGGDMGWVPLKILDSNLEYVAGKADIGIVSDPVQLSSAMQQGSQATEPFYLLLKTETATAKEVENPDYITALKGRLLQDWLTDQMSSKANKIELHGRGIQGGYDSTTNAWILYQIERLKRSRGIVDTTTTTTTDPLTGQ